MELASSYGRCMQMVLFPLLLLLFFIYVSSLNPTHTFTSFSLNPHLINSTSPLLNVKTSSGKIEEDLAAARSAIRTAVLRRSYTSDKMETFIPRGPVYRNAYAFHQSYIEMVKKFKVWAYREGEKPLVHGGPMKHIYAIEGHFIDEIESGKSPFTARHPDEAHAFFVPVSVAWIVQYIYLPITTYDRDQLVRIFTDYIRVVANKYPYWNATGGADHFMLSCHDWAPEVSHNNVELYKNFIRVLCNANTSEGFEPIRDVSLPELNISPASLTAPRVGRPAGNRTILAFFAGGSHGDIRRALLEQWKGKDDEVVVHEYLAEDEDYYDYLGRSKYCLCPSGYEVASPRVVEAVQSGCVPVIISDHYSLPFGDVLDWSKFSVRIPVERIGEVKRVLKGIGDDEYAEMQRRVVSVQRHFQLNRPPRPFDVFHMVLHSVWLRRLNFKHSIL